MNSVKLLRGLSAAIAAIAAVSAFAAPQHVNMRSLPYSTEAGTTIPVANSDSALAAKRTVTRADARKIGGFATSKAADGQKAVGDDDVVGWFRPLTPCRLLDTRNLGAPIGGPAFSPNTVRPISPQNPAPANKCGIPSSNVTALQVVFSTQNYTVNSGGYITFKAPGAAITTVNTVYNLGAQWAAASAVVPTNGSGEFDIWVATATAEVIVDVTGYYSDLGDINTGSQNFDIFGNTPGNVMEINNSGVGGTALVVRSTGATGGTALTVTASAADGVALNISNGSLKIAGAGVINSTTAPVFTHKVTAANLCPATGYTIINHTLLNNAPGAQVMITPRQVFDAGTDPLPANTSISAFYQTTNCGTALPNGGYWFVHLGAGAHAVGMAYNIMIIK